MQSTKNCDTESEKAIECENRIHKNQQSVGSNFTFVPFTDSSCVQNQYLTSRMLIYETFVCVRVYFSYFSLTRNFFLVHRVFTLPEHELVLNSFYLKRTGCHAQNRPNNAKFK